MRLESFAILLKGQRCVMYTGFGYKQGRQALLMLYIIAVIITLFTWWYGTELCVH